MATDRPADRRTAGRRRPAARPKTDLAPARKAAVAAAPARTAPGRRGVRLRACVIVVHLRGVTRQAARSEPAAVVRLLEEFYAAMTDVAVAHKATIDALLGDALLMLHGVPSPRRDDPARAVRTALQLQRTFLALRNRWLARGEAGAAALSLAVGVAAGEVLIANLRPSAGFDCTPVGEPVNGAVRLCGVARGGEILIDEATYTSVRTRLDSEVLFTSRGFGSRGRAERPAYRVQPRHAGLHVVQRRLAAG